MMRGCTREPQRKAIAEEGEGVSPLKCLCGGIPAGKFGAAKQDVGQVKVMPGLLKKARMGSRGRASVVLGGPSAPQQPPKTQGRGM